MKKNLKIFLGSGGFRTKARRALLLSELESFLGEVQEVLFIPYALADYDAYVKSMVKMNIACGRKLIGIHTFTNPIKAVKNAEAIFIGGGNTFRLLHTMQNKKLLSPIRKRILSGIPFIGVSAGTNVATPTIKTTNDMPIAQPKSLEALRLVPFQINPHYFSGPTFTKWGGKTIPYAGETRDDRIREFHEMNSTDVVGIWEGTIIRIEKGRAQLLGTERKGGYWFRKGHRPRELKPNTRLPAMLLR